MIDTWPMAGARVEPVEADGSMLLYAVAAVAVERADSRHGARWFQRRPSALAAVISREEDVSDILLRLPDSWNIVDGARCVGLHDDADILSGDPRFCRGFVETNCAIAGHSDGVRFALFLQINAAEAVLLPERLFVQRDAFERCLYAQP
ncbi:hypothetical protein [Paraburkholderia fungorum]|jgi:hypothetical protein|uniref:Uncharacterized protein n=1 Tax=Paraburkholderia fungorum TaxID=134537 RepID=A0AAP1L4T8_9BURK|nr:hypothetical protein [Paraburkholderia fungorum]AJZ61294.1 hypothetical protein OI25_4420 [Paraburkholderia fungorum]MBB4518974.1 hypothetical protein [Paraburkholderia fungorum]MBB5545931.1 hypothetical protein [Paraburkholderia fungorum]MBB6206819.1 hypothetical protein [Paraburkholderia fungorum]MDT8837466.1 hypothetical protein [Paraburkholderia fungorum]